MNLDARELPDFVRVNRGKRVTLVHPDFADAVSNALLDGKGTEPAGVVGRGRLSQVTTERGTVLIRRYIRGGMIGRVMKEVYTLDVRPLRELGAHMQAWRKGVPTVLPIGATWEGSGPYHSIAFATLRANAVDLMEYLQTHPDFDPAVLADCGRAIRAMHLADIYHRDLQVKNLIVATGAAFIIDFDGAKVKQVTPAMANRNLARLKRSFVKQGLPLTAFDAIATACFK